MRPALRWLAALALAGCVDSTYRCGPGDGEYACTAGLACDSVSGSCVPCLLATRKVDCPTGLVCTDTSKVANGCNHTRIFRCAAEALVQADGGDCEPEP